MAPSRVYLCPGMFGFAELAAYDYFEHVVAALRRRFVAAGRQIEVRVCEVHPTASIRRRAVRLGTTIAESAGADGGPIHIVGHSTGGLDARLVASPTVRLEGLTAGQRACIDRLRSITTMSTPHYGTPLASFFATAKGQQLLYALSALTVTALKLGSPPLATAATIVAALGRATDAVGPSLASVDRMVETLARVLDEASGRDLRAWLREMRDDQGSIVQLTPEAMDLFQAGVEDRPGVRYQSIATFAPPTGLRDWLEIVRTPWSALSAVVFHLLYRITAVQHQRYPCAPRDGSAEGQVRGLCGEAPPRTANDGVVPLYSQLWGTPVWIGRADHLDVVGHFAGPGAHTDWLTSGARFDLAQFETMMDRLVEGLLVAE